MSPRTGGYQLLPASLLGTPQRPRIPPRRYLTLGLVLCTVLLMGMYYLSFPSVVADLPIAAIPVTGEVDETGRIQVDLGPDAETRYNLGFTRHQEGGAKLFFTRLRHFTENLMPATLRPIMLESLATHLPPRLHGLIPIADDSNRAELQRPMVTFRNIFQTDKKDPGDWTKLWENKNARNGWVLDFYSDARAQEWVDQTFADAEDVRGVRWAYSRMQRGVLKADFLRYLLPLVKGGVYSDTDTIPKQPINEWGTHDPEYYDISATDGDDWMQHIRPHPEVIVGVDIDVHEVLNYFEKTWEQPLGICQWALSSAPYHPIMQEVTRRVVNNTETVDRTGRKMKVLHWTGPSAFTDSVLAYLLARYDVPWQHLRGRRRPLRIGEVMVLPITGFSPGGEKDFGAEPSNSTQCALVHGFSGSWKKEGV